MDGPTHSNNKKVEIIIPRNRKNQIEMGSNVTNSTSHPPQDLNNNKDVSPLSQSDTNNIQQLDITPAGFEKLLSITNTNLSQIPQIIITDYDKEIANMK